MMRNTRSIVAVAVAVYLLLVLFDRFVLVELLARRVGIPFLFAIAAALACVGTGFLARRLQHDIALNLVVGYPIFGAICFLIGLLKVSPWTMVPIVGALGGIGAMSASSLTRLFEPPSPRGEGPRSGGEGSFAFLVIALVFICAFISAQAPPSTLDELSYHLAVPWTWVKEGRAIDLPLNSHSYFPLGVESADLPFLSILGTSGGGIASHFLHFFAALAVTGVLLRRTADCTILTAAIVATPALAITAGWSLVDWVILGICVVLVEADDDATVSAALGAGLLTKYTFIPIALIAIVVQKKWRGAWPGLVIGSVFFIRNLILTGNPIAPFLTALAPHVAHYRSGAFLSDYIFDGRFVDESIGISILMACTLAAGMLSWILITAGVVLFLFAPSARLLVPFLAIPAARALPPSRPVRALLAVAVAMQLFLLAFFTDRTQAFALLSGRLSDEEYVNDVRPTTAAIAAVDAALPQNSRTLVIGLSETYWFQHRVRGGGNFDGPRVSAYLDAGSVDALYARLKRDGITHIAVLAVAPPTQNEKKIEERETALTPAAQRTLARMLDRFVASVTQRGGATPFALR